MPYFRGFISMRSIMKITNSVHKRSISTVGLKHTIATKVTSVFDYVTSPEVIDYVYGTIHGPTGEEVLENIDLTQKTCLITGANSGIGLEMTRCLSGRGCRVVMACRNTYAAGTAARALGHRSLAVQELNLASLKSVQKCAAEVVKEYKKLDIVILNAAVFGLPWKQTEDGLETIFQVNFLSQYYLLQKIEHILAPDARVVFVTSESHRNINWSVKDQLEPSESLLSIPEDRYTSIRAYNVSKLCGLLAMHWLGRRWAGSGRAVLGAHPGSFVKTRLCQNWWLWELLYTTMTPFTKTIRQAAATPLLAAASPSVRGLTAVVLKDCRRSAESDLAADSHLAARVIDLCHDMLQQRAAAQHHHHGAWTACDFNTTC